MRLLLSIIILIVFINSTTTAQYNFQISFDRVELDYDPYFASKDEVQIELYPSSDDCPTLDYTEDNFINYYKAPTARVEGLRSYSKSDLDSGSISQLLSRFEKEKTCFLCAQTKSIDVDELEWQKIYDELTLYPILINEKYPFLFGRDLLLFSYKGELILLMGNKICKSFSKNCPTEYGLSIEIDTLCALEEKIENVEVIQIDFNDKPALHSDSLIYYFESDQFRSQNISSDNFALFGIHKKETNRQYLKNRVNVKIADYALEEKVKFTNGIKDLTFFRTDENTHYYIQHYTGNLFVKYEVQFEDSSKVGSEVFRGVFPLVINDNLINCTFGMSNNYVILKNPKGYIAYDNYYAYKQTIKKELSSEIIDQIILENRHFRIIETKTGVGLRDHYENEFYIPAIYDSIDVIGHFAHAYKDEQLYLFDKRFNLIDLDYSKLRATYIYNYNLQVLYGNEIMWVNKDGYLQKEETHYYQTLAYCGCCGPYYNYSIRHDDPNHFILDGYAEEYSFDNDKTDTLRTQEIIIDRQNFDSLIFLSGKSHMENPKIFYKKYYPEGATYIFKKNDKQGIFTKIILDHKNNLTQDSILLNNVDEVYPKYGITSPTRFRIGNKFHFYPLSEKAKYAKLEEFNQGFARFKINRRKMGWLSLEGKEYYDK